MNNLTKKKDIFRRTQIRRHNEGSTRVAQNSAKKTGGGVGNRGGISFFSWGAGSE